ncbi:MAG: hypothetical protein JWO50_432 [Candidatus Kaiserbacteria bacterium]|nr:hypothetical protein [Candidatus Kaiserbacteria bacterium]
MYTAQMDQYITKNDSGSRDPLFSLYLSRVTGIEVLFVAK